MNKVKIIVYENSIRFINYLIYHNIYYDDLECFKDYFILIVKYNDYKKISRRYKCKIYKFYGKESFIYFIYFYRYLLISFIFSMFILYLLSNTIFEIRINSDNKEIVSLISNTLDNYGISKYKKKKNFEELTSIKEKLLNENKDSLEWLEITEKGCTYIVDVTPRIKSNIKEDNNSNTSIYASHDGVIKYITVTKGTKIREVNDYVKKGDLLISGNIYKDDKIVDYGNALGQVYAETWYFVKTEVPFKYKEVKETGKVINHYYVKFNNKKFTIVGKYDDPSISGKEKLVFNKPYFFKIYKEVKRETKDVERQLTAGEAFNIAIKRSVDEVQNKLDNDEFIMSKKVLKKDVKSGKMYIEVFFKVYENIGVTSNTLELGENNGKSN